MNQRVTQSDVARIAGVHNTTVSLSLRNCPSIPEATRKRIRTIADEMGYYPDPALQALVAYRKGRLCNRPRESLAYMTHWETRWGWRAFPSHERAYAGAMRKAAQLGYQLQHFWLGEPGMTQRRMGDMLYHRGITGVLVAANGRAGGELAEIDWSRLSAVTIGDFSHSTAHHRVTDDHGGAIRLAMRSIRAAGFERIGFAMAQGRNEIADQAWTAGFLIEQGRSPAGGRIPILRLAGGPQRRGQGLGDAEALARWHHEYRPEVIIGSSPSVLGMIPQIRLEVPRDVAYVDLCLERVDLDVAGVRQNGEIAGEVATAMLVGQLQQNLCGMPSIGTSTMVDGSWVDGASLPPVKRAGPCEGRPGVPRRPVESILLASA